MIRFTPVLLAGLVLAAVPAYKADAKPKSKSDKHEKHLKHEKHGTWSPSSRRDEGLGWDRVPPGASKGRKTGWDGRGVPPGQSGRDVAYGRGHTHSGKNRR